MTQAARAERCKRWLFTIENGNENCCDNSQLTVLEQHELRKRIPEDAEKLVSWKLPNNKDENKTPEKIFSQQSLREFHLIFLSFFLQQIVNSGNGEKNSQKPLELSGYRIVDLGFVQQPALKSCKHCKFGTKI